MKSLYYYVPPCPACGSRVTGRYLKQPWTSGDTAYKTKESLQHGELIRFLPKEPMNNAYCEECGYEWPQRVEAKFFSKQRIAEEMSIRGTNRKYAEYMEKNPKKKRGIIRNIFGLFT